MLYPHKIQINPDVEITNLDLAMKCATEMTSQHEQNGLDNFCQNTKQKN
jgi:hypothetical protein